MKNKLNHKHKYKYDKFEKYEKFETVQIKLRTGEPENWWRIEGAVHFFKDATHHDDDHDGDQDDAHDHHDDHVHDDDDEDHMLLKVNRWFTCARCQNIARRCQLIDNLVIAIIVVVVVVNIIVNIIIVIVVVVVNINFVVISKTNCCHHIIIIN